MQKINLTLGKDDINFLQSDCKFVFYLGLASHSLLHDVLRGSRRTEGGGVGKV